MRTFRKNSTSHLLGHELGHEQKKTVKKIFFGRSILLDPFLEIKDNKPNGQQVVATLFYVRFIVFCDYLLFPVQKS